MEATLQASSLHVLLILTSKLLTREGFGDVQILGRRQTKQKSRFGGHEIMCETTIGSEPAKVVVKVVNDAGRLRHLDELSGVADRTSAAMSLLVTPHNLTKSAMRNQPLYRRSRVEIFDGAKLASLMFKHKVGTRGTGDVDYEYFGALEDASDALLGFMATEGL